MDQIELPGTTIEYDLKRNRRSRAIRLIVHQGGEVVVTAPTRTSRSFIEDFIRQKADWVIRHIERLKHLKPQLSASAQRAHYQTHKPTALAVVRAGLEKHNAHYGFTYNRISIRNQHTRWGSCSRTGNLSFNYKIALLPAHMVDYIIVHELCHLKELNHSPRFWALVARAVPNYKAIRRELRSQDRLLN